MVVDEGLAGSFPGGEAGEREMEYGCAHLCAQATAALARAEPGERGDGPELGELDADEVLHPDWFAVDDHDEVQAPHVGVHAGPPCPDGSQPPPFAERAVLEEGHWVVERQGAGADHAGANHGYQLFQTFVGCAGEGEARRAHLEAERGVDVRHGSGMYGIGSVVRLRFRRGLVPSVSPDASSASPFTPKVPRSSKTCEIGPEVQCVSGPGFQAELA